MHNDNDSTAACTHLRLDSRRISSILRRCCSDCTCSLFSCFCCSRASSRLFSSASLLDSSSLYYTVTNHSDVVVRVARSSNEEREGCPTFSTRCWVFSCSIFAFNRLASFVIEASCCASFSS